MNRKIEIDLDGKVKAYELNKENNLRENGSKYILLAFLIAMFLIALGGCDSKKNIDTSLSKIAKEDGVSKTVKIARTVISDMKIGSLYALSEDEIKNIYNIEVNDYNEYVAYSSIFPNDIKEFVIIDINSYEQSQKVEAEYKRRLEEIIEKANEKQVKKIQNAIIATTHDYSIFIVDDNSKEIYSKLQSLLNELSQ